MKLNHEVSLTKDDKPHVWTTCLSWAANSHLRVEGFSPFQAVFDRDLRIPTNLLSDDAVLPALSAALGPAGRAEQIRQAALKTFFELGNKQAIERAARQQVPGTRLGILVADARLGKNEQTFASFHRMARASSCDWNKGQHTSFLILSWLACVGFTGTMSTTQQR